MRRGREEMKKEKSNKQANNKQKQKLIMKYVVTSKIDNNVYK